MRQVRYNGSIYLRTYHNKAFYLARHLLSGAVLTERFLMKKAIPFSNLLYVFFLTILLTLKSALFYSALHLATFELPLALGTGGLFLLFYTLLVLLSPHAACIAATALYWIASIFMGVDGVYYAYVSKLPSVALINMLWQLDDVSDTIQNLILPRHLAMIADFPFLLIIKINRDLISARLSHIKLSSLLQEKGRMVCPPGKVLLSGGGICLAVTALIAFYPDFEPQYMINELFCYHISDLVTTLSTHGDEREVNKALYTEPDWSESEYWGLAEGRNVFIIQVEAMQNFVIGRSYEGQEIMPNLNALIANDSFYFDQYYYQIGGGNTSDAEFAVNNSLFAPESEAAYVKYPYNDYYGLPYLLKDNGYSGAHVFHAYIPEFWNRQTAYPAQGFDTFTSLEDMEQTDMFPMGLSDKEMFRQSIEQLKTYEEPFYAFYITLSSHHPYGIPLKDRDIVLKPEDEQTLYGLYLQAINYTDRAIGEFIRMLKEAELYENSIIVIYGDHYALSNTDSNNMTHVSELLGRQYSLFDVFNIPLIVHIPGMEHTETISTAGGHMDVLPTLLPLLAIHNDKAVMFGQNLLEAEVGIVCEQTHMAIGSFISNDVFFKKPHNNIKANYDAYEWDTIKRLDPDLFTELSDWCAERIADCAALLSRNDVLLE